MKYYTTIVLYSLLKNAKTKDERKTIILFIKKKISELDN